MGILVWNEPWKGGGTPLIGYRGGLKEVFFAVLDDTHYPTFAMSELWA